MRRLLALLFVGLLSILVLSTNVSASPITVTGHGAYSCQASSCYSEGVAQVNGGNGGEYLERAHFPAVSGFCSGTITPMNVIGKLTFSGTMSGNVCAGTDSLGN